MNVQNKTAVKAILAFPHTEIIATFKKKDDSLRTMRFSWAPKEGYDPALSVSYQGRLLVQDHDKGGIRTINTSDLVKVVIGKKTYTVIGGSEFHYYTCKIGGVQETVQARTEKEARDKLRASVGRLPNGLTLEVT